MILQMIEKVKAGGKLHGFVRRTEDVPGVVDEDGEFLATRVLSGTRHRKKKDTHKGTPQEDGKDIIHKNCGKEMQKDLKNVRIIKLGMNVYRTSFYMPYDIGSGRIEIVTVGENGKSNKLHIREAKSISSCSGINVSGTDVYFSNMKSDAKVILEFSLVDTRDYAMEVNVYEHN